jgi:hypothetical protein
MSRCCSLIGLLFISVCSAQLADPNLWHEFGLEQKSTAKAGTSDADVYRLKDLTGAVAAWEWQRSPDAHPCEIGAFCWSDSKGMAVSVANYLVIVRGHPSKAEIEAFLNALPNKHDSSLPAIFTFVPRHDLVPNTARYILGPESLKKFAPELANLNLGFTQGTEGQVAEYKSPTGPLLHLAIFDFATPELARAYLREVAKISGVFAKRSGVLVGVVFGGANKAEADRLLGRVEYEAKVTWNEIPPPSPVKPLYQLLVNIIYLSCILAVLCLMAGLSYAAMRLYRRRFGTLEADESMTTLHLS